MSDTLEQQITRLFQNPPERGYTDEHNEIFEQFKSALNEGQVRAAVRLDGVWNVNLWVKQGILLGFRMGAIRNYSINDQFRYFDKH